MALAASDIKIYGSVNMQETDTGSQGGKMKDTTKIVFDDLSTNDALQIVSSAAGDTSKYVTVYGRNAGGSIITASGQLNGTTPVALAGTFERLLKSIKDASTTGDVAVEGDSESAVADTAQSGTTTTITLHAGASATDNLYRHQVIRLTGGTGANQIREVIAYDGTTKIATVSRAWSTTPYNDTTFRLAEGMVFDKSPTEIMTVRRPFYNATANAAGGASKDYYEKIFIKNTGSSNNLLTAQVVESADPSTYITFDLEKWQGSGVNTSTNRVTAPAAGMLGSFDSATKSVPSTDLMAGSGIGVWMKLTLAAGTAPAKTSWTVQTTGSTT
jgi:hypothetical protein